MPFWSHRMIVIWLIWGALAVEFVISILGGRWSTAFVCVGTLSLTILPVISARRFGIRLPVSFSTMIAAFVFATLFLGEVFDFYERYWWWDVVLHGASALGFGLLGTLLILMLFEGDRYAAPPIALATMSFCMAVSIGAIWEIFEFGMDQIFGMNMQKSGLVDTMHDLIVDTIGAFIGASVGFFYLKGREIGGFAAVIDEFVALNRRLYRKAFRRE